MMEPPSPPPSLLASADPLLQFDRPAHLHREHPYWSGLMTRSREDTHFVKAGINERTNERMRLTTTTAAIFIKERYVTGRGGARVYHTLHTHIHTHTHTHTHTRRVGISLLLLLGISLLLLLVVWTRQRGEPLFPPTTRRTGRKKKKAFFGVEKNRGHKKEDVSRTHPTQPHVKIATVVCRNSSGRQRSVLCSPFGCGNILWIFVVYTRQAHLHIHVLFTRGPGWPAT